MAYQSGQLIQASSPSTDYNEIAALVNEVFGDVHSGNLDIGTGDFGYGQTPTISNVTAGEIVTANHWTSILSTVSACAVHQGTSVGSIPSSVTTGSLIDAYDTPESLLSLVTDIRDNRLNIAPSESQVTSGGVKLTETAISDWTEQIVHGFEVNFNSTDEARHFFNSGGQIHWSASYTPGNPDESGEEVDWQIALDRIGTLQFGATATSSTGTPGAVSNSGFYDLAISPTTTLMTDQIGNINTGYGVENILVTVTALDNLTRLVFTVFLTTESLPDRVLNGTLNSFVDQRRSVGSILSTEPTYTTVAFNVS
jgi:hypothetical protein